MSALETTVRVERHRCPSCGAALDTVTGTGLPEDGSFTGCAYCGQRFELRVLPSMIEHVPRTREELAALDPATAAEFEQLREQVLLAFRRTPFYLCTSCGYPNRRAQDVRRRRCQKCHRHGAIA